MDEHALDEELIEMDQTHPTISQLEKAYDVVHDEVFGHTNAWPRSAKVVAQRFKAEIFRLHELLYPAPTDAQLSEFRAKLRELVDEDKP